MNLSEFAQFEQLKRALEELKARVEVLEMKRAPGRPPNPEKKAA